MNTLGCFMKLEAGKYSNLVISVNSVEYAFLVLLLGNIKNNRCSASTYEI